MVSTEKLQALTDMLAPNDISIAANETQTTRTEKESSPLHVVGKINVPEWIRRNLGPQGISITGQLESEGTVLWRLNHCPFNPQHKSPDSVIAQRTNGAVFFRCLHQSCEDNDWSKLRRQFELVRTPESTMGIPTPSISDQPTGPMPIFDVNCGQLREVTSKVTAAIVAAGKQKEPIVYVRGSTLVRIIHNDSERRPKIDILNPDSMKSIMSTVADFVRTNRTGTVDAPPPADWARAILKAGDWPFPILRGIVNTPIVRRNGTICDTPGYDAISGLYYCPYGPIPEISEAPTQKDAIAAAEFVLDSISDFPFDHESSRDNALGLFLTVVIREMVPLVPMAILSAPIRGSGKTRLAQAAAIIAQGHEIGVSCEVRSEDDWRKNTTSLLLRDDPVIIIDNVEHVLYSGTLAAALTSTTWTDRLLGKTETITLPNRSTWIATGNNCSLGGDLGRRSYLIRLDSRTAKPWLTDSREKFKYFFPTWALQNRHKLIEALLTMVKAWHLMGAPAWSKPPIGSFEGWSQTIGGILEFCGVTHFLQNMNDLYEVADREPQEWEVLFESIFELYHERPFTVNDLMQCANRAEYSGAIEQERNLRDSIPESLGDIRDRGFASRLGYAIRRRMDQRFELEDRTIQLQLVRRDSHTKRPQWKITEISSS